MPKISVVVISYNSENIVEKTFESIINQSYKDFELILVDKNSKDKTLEIAGQYKNNIKKWISEPCKSDFDAMNKGILLSQGEYIIFLNASETFFDKNTLNKISSNLDNADDIVWGKVNIEGKIINPDFNKKYHLYGKEVFLCSEFIKRSFLENMGGFDTRFKFKAGYEFNLRAILKNNAKIKFVNEVISNVPQKDEIFYIAKNIRRYYKEKKVIQRAYFSTRQIFIYKLLNLLLK